MARTGEVHRHAGPLRRLARQLVAHRPAGLDDGRDAHLVEASLTCRSPGFRVVWGVSVNTRRRWALTGAHEIGYRPQDDAEDFAAEVGDRTAATDGYVGGEFAGPAFDTPD